MRKSKSRKQAKKLLPKKMKEIKANKLATKKKLEAWKNLPLEQWSAARVEAIEKLCIADEVKHATQWREETLEELQ